MESNNVVVDDSSTKTVIKELKELEYDDDHEHNPPKQSIHRKKEPSSKIIHNHSSENILGDLPR